MSNSRLISGTPADVPVVPSRSGVLVDVQARRFGTMGHIRREHAYAGLSVTEAQRLRHLLGEAIAAAGDEDPRQCSSWPRWTEAAARGVR